VWTKPEYSGGCSFIPEGTNAFIHTYSLQRDSRYFSPLPDSFLPERWLSEDQRFALEPKIFHSQQKYINNTAAFIPFSMGAANCAGKNFAWMEMRMAVSAMVSRFDLKLDPSYDPQKWYEDMCDYFVMVKGPLPTLLSPRASRAIAKGHKGWSNPNLTLKGEHGLDG
jgi:cytochrome P450